jgi:arylsulfatase A-like enzyme
VRAFIDSHCSGAHADTPFFEYVAYTAPHWPLHAHDDDIAKYRGRADAGWDALRQARLDNLVASGILSRTGSSPIAIRPSRR